MEGCGMSSMECVVHDVYGTSVVLWVALLQLSVAGMVSKFYSVKAVPSLCAVLEWVVYVVDIGSSWAWQIRAVL